MHQSQTIQRPEETGGRRAVINYSSRNNYDNNGVDAAVMGQTVSTGALHWATGTGG